MTKINIVIGTCRSVDQDPTKNPIPSLNIEVGVIPARAILDRTPRICQGITGSNRALSDTRGPVHLVRAVLSDSMEMETRPVVLE